MHKYILLVARVNTCALQSGVDCIIITKICAHRNKFGRAGKANSLYRIETLLQLDMLSLVGWRNIAGEYKRRGLGIILPLDGTLPRRL